MSNTICYIFFTPLVLPAVKLNTSHTNSKLSVLLPDIFYYVETSVEKQGICVNYVIDGVIVHVV